jgi:hypothetical protein
MLKASGPFVHEDDDDDDNGMMTLAEADLPSSIPRTVLSPPLQSISPNASPRRAMGQPDAANDMKQQYRSEAQQERLVSPLTSLPDSKTSKPDTEARPPQHRSQSELTANLESILQRRATSRTTTSSCGQNPAQRIKNRRLGRAASGSSLNARSFSNNSADAVQPCDLLDMDSEADDSTARARPPPAEPPSTQLGYETPGVEAARAQIGKRMGTVFSDDGAGTRLASLGTVKDSVGSTSTAGLRAKGRHRGGK